MLLVHHLLSWNEIKVYHNMVIIGFSFFFNHKINYVDLNNSDHNSKYKTTHALNKLYISIILIMS